MKGNPSGPTKSYKLLNKSVFDRKCENMQYTCCVWGYTAADWSKHPYWPLSFTVRTYSGHVSIRAGPWSNGRAGLINHTLLYNMRTAGRNVCHVPEGDMAPGWIMGRRHRVCSPIARDTAYVPLTRQQPMKAIQPPRSSILFFSSCTDRRGRDQRPPGANTETAVNI